MVPDSVLKEVFSRIGEFMGGPFGAAIGGFASTSAVLEKEVFEIGEKIAAPAFWPRVSA